MFMNKVLYAYGGFLIGFGVFEYYQSGSLYFLAVDGLSGLACWLATRYRTIITKTDFGTYASLLFSASWLVRTYFTQRWALFSLQLLAGVLVFEACLVQITVDDGYGHEWC